MWRVLVLSLWCSVSIFSKTEFYFVPTETPVGEWLEQVHFPSIFLHLENTAD